LVKLGTGASSQQMLSMGLKKRKNGSKTTQKLKTEFSNGLLGNGEKSQRILAEKRSVSIAKMI